MDYLLAPPLLIYLRSLPRHASAEILLSALPLDRVLRARQSEGRVGLQRDTPETRAAAPKRRSKNTLQSDMQYLIIVTLQTDERELQRDTPEGRVFSYKETLQKDSPEQPAVSQSLNTSKGRAVASKRRSGVISRSCSGTLQRDEQ